MTHSQVIPVAPTKKGHRLWIQGLRDKGIVAPRFTVTITPEAITIVLGTEGKRAVTVAKGGIVDIESKKVTQWAQGATQALVTFTPDTLTITRA